MEDYLKEDYGTGTKHRSETEFEENIDDVDGSFMAKKDNMEKTWEVFMLEINSPTECDSPRKNINLDADLHKSLSELNFKGISLSKLANIMIRSFMEGHAEKLMEHRSKTAKSIFDKYSIKQ